MSRRRRRSTGRWPPSPPRANGPTMWPTWWWTWRRGNSAFRSPCCNQGRPERRSPSTAQPAPTGTCWCWPASTTGPPRRRRPAAGPGRRPRCRSSACGRGSRRWRRGSPRQWPPSTMQSDRSGRTPSRRGSTRLPATRRRSTRCWARPSRPRRTRSSRRPPTSSTGSAGCGACFTRSGRSTPGCARSMG